VQGQGHALVLIHGGFMDLRMWDDQFTEFARHYRVVRLNLRGFGKTDPPTEKFSYVDDVEAVLTHLKIEKVYVLGLSLGGMVAVDFATTHPEQVDALILAGAPLIGAPDDPKEREQMAAQFAALAAAQARGDWEKAVELTLALPFFNPAEPSPAVRQRMETMIRDNLKTWVDSQGRVVWPTTPAVERLGAIKAPTLVLVGDRDVKAMLIAADGLTARIAGAKKGVIAGASHHLNLEKPQEFNKLVLGFLAQR
jgi:pimeloyl-ACP methyl ester carboxylesterase